MHSRKLLVYVLLFSIGSILCFLLASFMLKSWYIVDVQQRDVRISVTEPTNAGFDVNTTLLTFGKLPAGGSATRNTMLSSQVPTIAKIRIEPESMAKFVYATPNPVYVNSSGTGVVFSAVIPQDTPLGNYSGTVTIIYTRRMPWD